MAIFSYNVSLSEESVRRVVWDVPENQLFVEPSGQGDTFFDGVLYNAVTLRRSLGLTTSDIPSNAALLWALYQRDGEEVFKQLDGSFVFALRDGGVLLTGRDRTGMRALYCASRDGVEWFSTDLRQLAAINEIRCVDRLALLQYLTFCYIPAPRTIYAGITKLPAAGYVLCRPACKPETRIYWEPDYAAPFETYQQSVDAVRDAVYDSVTRCYETMSSPAGFLSGGLDSTAMLGILSRISGKTVDAFTIGFIESEMDERDHAAVAAKALNARHHVYLLKEEDAIASIPEIIGLLDEPYADASMIPTRHLMHFTGAEVADALTGDGGDEQFAGYMKHLIGYYTCLYNRVPGWARWIFEHTYLQLPDDLPGLRMARKVATNASFPSEEQRLRLLCNGLLPTDALGLISPNMRVMNDAEDCLAEARAYYFRHEKLDELSRTLYTDFKFVLEGDMLPKISWMNRDSLLRIHAPLLSNAVLDTAARVPSAHKLQGSRTKAVFRDAFSDLIPSALQKRAKQGFGVPLNRWFRNKMASELRSSLCGGALAADGILNQRVVEIYLNEHLSGRRNHATILWSLYVLSKWWEREQPTGLSNAKGDIN